MEMNTNKRDLQNEANRIVIESPCSVSWESMDGDDKVRFCGDCKKNVHNLTNMPPEQAADILSRRVDEKLCVFMYKRKDGKVALDKCPAFLRKKRDRVRAYAVAALLTLSWILASSAEAQGLVGTPPLLRYGTANEVGQLADYNYDTARDINNVVTLIATLVVMIFPYKRTKTSKLRQSIGYWLAFATIPILVHLLGTFLINNHGGGMGGL